MNSGDANLNNQLTKLDHEIVGSASNVFLLLVCRLSFAGVRPAYVHHFGLGDRWELPICRYSIMGWPIGVMRTTATGWTG
jgi:hypothetical protein